MIRSIWDQTGTPQDPVDWSEPDAWINERLSAEEAELAQRIWQSSDHSINPRYSRGCYLFINGYELLSTDPNGIYQLSERGRSFLNNDDGIIREIDELEGLIYLLEIISTKTRAKRGDLLPEWSEFLHEHSKFGTQSTIKDTLRRRILNLIDRELVSREGNVYFISAKGKAYISIEPLVDPKLKVMEIVNAYNTRQRELLRARLAEMPPQQFEQLISQLLEAMGYEDVIVTKESGDKGVDVIATVQFGITTITEVVQVKRHQSNISRPVLDQLRGALPYHNALRGTLITLGNFSNGCTKAALFPGAAPITLINGDKLLDLLMEHEIGIQKRPVTLYELEEDFLKYEEKTEQDDPVSDEGDKYR